MRGKWNPRLAGTEIVTAGMAEGLAYPKRGVVTSMPMDPSTRSETLVYELSHIAFEQIDRFNIAQDGSAKVWLHGSPRAMGLIESGF